MDLNLDDIAKLFTGNYVIGFETEQNDHFHAVYYGEKMKTEVLQNILGVSEQGNKLFSCKPVKDLRKATMYAVKDENIKISESNEWLNEENEFWHDFIEESIELSFKKPKSYIIQLNTLYDEYQNGKITSKELWVKICEARTYFDLGIAWHKIDELVRTQMCKKNPELIRIEADSRKLFSGYIV